MSVRAKFKCIAAEKSYEEQVNVRLEAVTDDGTPENERWHRYTPCGSLEMSIDNPAAAAQFELGKEYFLDITPAPSAAQ